MVYFLAQWVATALALWVSSYLFNGVRFETASSLVIAALLLGVANAIVKPLLVILTLPLTIFSFGFFLLVINALVLMLVSSMVKGFEISGFGTAFFASIIISILTMLINSALVGDIVINKSSSNGPWV